ncbi:MAG: PD-(D/E)XK nuclease family protein [Gallionellaceae bacterium]|nr:PD-(D/E)XK nuclease family protein [Gallionellaceae bacterium]
MSNAHYFFDRIAERILHAQTLHLPDLRRLTVIIPNSHVAKPLAQALIRVAQRPVLLLPQMVTLNDWAQSVPLADEIVSDSQRSALLYQILRDKKWFEQTDLWGMTQELLGLFDELTQALNTLPANEDAFVDAVEQAYQSRQNSTLQLEARLVFELWHAMQNGNELDAARAYQYQLAQLAQHPQQSLCVMRTSDWTGLEQRFLEQYATQAEMLICDLREMQNDKVDFVAHTLAAEPKISLLEQAAFLKNQTISLRERLSFFAASSLEQEARAASMQVRLWVKAGKQNIAVVAQDRVAARRLRALLERAQILVADETGWTFATLSVSTVLMRWLDALQSDFYHHDLLDLLKSPFVFSEMAAVDRKELVYQIEQLLRKQSIVAGLDKFIERAENESALQQPFLRLRQAAVLFEQNKRHTISKWLIALQHSLQILGIDVGLQEDAAGSQLLNFLQGWQQELAQDSGLYRFAEWRRWLAQKLDTETYRDNSIDSSICFTHLAATRWRAFDAVVLLGCDADHLPSVADGGSWFNDAVRGSLNLATRETHAARQRDDLIALLRLNDCVLVTWQKERSGEKVLLSPYLQMLRDLHALTFASDLSEEILQGYLLAEEESSLPLAQALQPKPSVETEQVPQRISISAYNSLIACPYQFFARHILRLNELDDVQEGIEKRDYGERVHEILCRFHGRYPLISAHQRAEMQINLQQISQEVFADLLAQDFSARAWLARWLDAVPAYLDWQVEGEAQGWRYAEAESTFESGLEGVQLRGRIDRLDVRGEEKRVLDYKTQSDQVLRNKLLEAGEDVQLASYAYAYSADEAAFLSIENDKVKSIEPKQDFAQLTQLNAERLVQMMAQLRSGTPLPANGVDASCVHCEMRGVCRKGEWVVRNDL